MTNDVHATLKNILGEVYDEKTIKEVSIIIEYLISTLEPVRIVFGGVSEENEILFVIVVKREVGEEERVIRGTTNSAIITALTVSERELTDEERKLLNEMPIVYERK